MSGTAGETKEPECRTKGLACVLEPVQSPWQWALDFRLFHLFFILFPKKKERNWPLNCWISAPQLSTSSHPLQYSEGEAGAGGWGEGKVDSLWFCQAVLLHNKLALCQKCLICLLFLYSRVYSNCIYIQQWAILRICWNQWELNKSKSL